jgi:hypothetical protein
LADNDEIGLVSLNGGVTAAATTTREIFIHFYHEIRSSAMS